VLALRSLAATLCAVLCCTSAAAQALTTSEIIKAFHGNWESADDNTTNCDTNPLALSLGSSVRGPMLLASWRNGKGEGPYRSGSQIVSPPSTSHAEPNYFIITYSVQLQSGWRTWPSNPHVDWEVSMPDEDTLVWREVGEKRTATYRRCRREVVTS
jgi:hypothetical protein